MSPASTVVSPVSSPGERYSRPSPVSQNVVEDDHVTDSSYPGYSTPSPGRDFGKRISESDSNEKLVENADTATKITTSVGEETKTVNANEQPTRNLKSDAKKEEKSDDDDIKVLESTPAPPVTPSSIKEQDNPGKNST